MVTVSVGLTVCVNGPSLPVTVNTVDATGVVVAVVIVNVVALPEPTVAGTNDAEAPAGSPDTANVTDPALPICVVAIVYVAEVPALTVWLGGLAAIVKSAGAVTTSVGLVECVNGPSLPVTVNVVEPAAVVVSVVIVSDVVVPAGEEVGENDAEAPAGNPDTLKLTVPGLPTWAVLIVYVVDVPALTV